MKFTVFILFIAMLAGVTVHAQTKGQRGPREKVDLNTIPDSSYYPGELYFKFKPGFEPFLKKDIGKNAKGELLFGIGKLDQLLSRLQAKGIRRSFEPILSKTGFAPKHESFDLQRWYTLDIPKHTSVKQAIEQLLLLTDIIEIAEPNFKRQLLDDTDPVQMWTPSDSAYNQQWHFNHTNQQGNTNPAETDADIDLPEAWELETGKPNVIVAVFDGGVDTSHPDLRPNLWVGNGGEHFGYNWNTYSPLIQPNTHGTHVNGIIGAVNNNTIGISGVAGGNGTSNSGARLMSMQVFSNGGSYAGDAAVANAYVFAADRGAAIAQNSWGGGSFSTILTDAIDYFIMYGGGNTLSGGIVFFSAGNNGNETQNFPGTYPPVVCVTGSNYDDKKSWYSVYGDWVDIVAPGGEVNAYSGGPLLFGGKKGILSTVPVINGGLYAWMQGTSMACPHVSGVAALCISKTPGIMSSEQLRNILLNNTDDIYPFNPDYVGKLGAGRVNAFKAVQAAAMQSASLVDSVFNFNVVQNCGQATLSWSKNVANNNVMIAASDTLLFGLPTGSYNVDDLIAGGGKIIYKGSGTTTVVNLPVNQRKYFRIWSYSGTNYSLSKTNSALYKIVAGVPSLEDACGCLIDISWNDVLSCATDSIMLLAFNRSNYDAPSGVLQVGDTVQGGAKVIYKGRANSFAYNTDFDSTIYIQKWNFNVTAQYTNPDEFAYYDINKPNTIANIQATAAGSSSMNIQWQSNASSTCFNSNTYMLVYSTSNVFGNPSGTYQVGDDLIGGGKVIYIGSNTQFLHNGLQENTNYCYKLFKLRNSREYSFGKTACASTACSVSTIQLPYAYGFNGDDLSDPDMCLWQVENNSNISSAIKIVNSGTHPDILPLEGIGMLRFNAYNISSDQTARLRSHAIVKGGGNSMDLRFRWYQDSSNYTSELYDGEGVMVQWCDNSFQWKNLEYYSRVPAHGLTGWSYKQISLPDEAKTKDTVFVAFMFTSKFGNNMFLDDLLFQISSYKPSDGTMKEAVCESTDSSSLWTNYFDSTGKRLLSIKKYGNDIGHAGLPTFQLKIAGNSSASVIPMGNNYVSNPGGWICMNRYYECHPATEPVDTVQVRFYFTASDVTGLSNAGAALTPPRTSFSASDLFAYKINDNNNLYNPNPTAGHQNISLATGYKANGYVQYFNAAKADTSGWKYSNIGNGIHVMEYTVSKLSDGGGLGIGSVNGYGALALFTYTFTGNGNWNTASNWLNNAIPPALLPSNAQVIINPAGTGECVLNIEQHVMPGASIKVMPGKKFRIASNLQINQ
jgi:subtilisin family serine protease